MKKSAEIIEKGIIDAILAGPSPPGSTLPSERDLAARYEVNRAVVREALQRLAAAGWITVSQRRATVVNDFWTAGNLDILSAIAKNAESFPMEVVAHLLELRAELAPAYARKAVQNDSAQVIACLAKARKLGDNAGAYAKFDWELHRTMALLSGNRVYPLILNSFAGLYFKLRGRFFTADEYRTIARSYYQKLMHAALNENGDEAAEVTSTAMWQRVHVFRRQMAERGYAGKNSHEVS